MVSRSVCPEFLERAAFPDERRWQFADTVTLTAGNHTWKWGGDINFVKDIINNLRFLGGEFNYTGANGIGDFIVDYTNFATNGAIRALSEYAQRSERFVRTPVVVIAWIHFAVRASVTRATSIRASVFSV